MNIITAVICDLDGLLADTEKHHLRAYRETLAGYGIDLNPEEYINHWIRHGKGIANYIEKYQLSLVAPDVRNKKAARYRDLIKSEAEAMPGAVSLLKRLKDSKRLALASNSYRTEIDLVMDKIGIGEFFETVTSSNDVRQPKPSPDIFTRTAATLGLPPENCIVLEDAQKGVEAAFQAGMKCIAVPNEYTRNDDFSLATAVVPSLDDITVDFIDSL